MGAGDVLGRRELTVDGSLAEPLVGRKLIGHEPQSAVRFEGDETGAKDARCSRRIKKVALATNLFQVLRSLHEGLARE
jgi:hypothetical protein